MMILVLFSQITRFLPIHNGASDTITDLAGRLALDVGYKREGITEQDSTTAKKLHLITVQAHVVLQPKVS